MQFEHPVDDGNVSAFNLEDNNLSHTDLLLLVVGEEQQVAPLQVSAGQQVKEISKSVCESRQCRTWNAGSMLPLSTTTIGDSEPVTTIRPFQIISAEETIIPNDRT